jgi:hypothetical protein
MVRRQDDTAADQEWICKGVKENDGFFEWYSVDNKPRGSGTFRGEAGVLYKAIIMLEDYSKRYNAKR